MKNALILSAVCTSVGLVGCNRDTPSSTAAASSADKSTERASPPATTTAMPDLNPREPAEALAKNVHASASAATAGRVAVDPTTGYATKEVYQHEISEASVTALIGGGSGQSGGPAIAASSSTIDARIKEWHLSGADLQSDLDRGVAIVRTKEIGPVVPTGRAEDALLATLVNNRLLADRETVRGETHMDTANGEISLHGNAASADLIGRTIAIVLDTKGVTKVTSDQKIGSVQTGVSGDNATRAVDRNETAPAK